MRKILAGMFALAFAFIPTQAQAWDVTKSLSGSGIMLELNWKPKSTAKESPVVLWLSCDTYNGDLQLLALSNDGSGRDDFSTSATSIKVGVGKKIKTVKIVNQYGIMYKIDFSQLPPSEISKASTLTFYVSRKNGAKSVVTFNTKGLSEFKSKFVAQGCRWR
jgi:hypothetical protein